MLFDLDDDTALLQRTVREFAAAEVAPAAGELDRTKSFPYEIVAKMAQLGWMGIPFPESVGGSGGPGGRGGGSKRARSVGGPGGGIGGAGGAADVAGWAPGARSHAERSARANSVQVR